MFSYFYGSPVPKCDLDMDPPFKEGDPEYIMTECLVKKDSPPDDNYLRFTQQVEEYVGADCWAVEVDGKLVFNDYENKSIREKIIDDTIRHEMINNIHKTVFVNFFRVNKDASMTIYMFGSDSYSINIKFEANFSETESRFVISFKKSQDYVDKFENTND